MKNIVLVGFMGTGKTTVAKKLARRLKMVYVSTDDLIEKSQARRIKDIFSKDGEDYFREIEKRIIGEISKKDNQVIDAGGGAVIKDENIKNLKRAGVLICLAATPQIVLDRTKGMGHRPLLSVSDPIKKIEELLAARAPYYAKADHQLDTSGKSVDQVVDEAIRLARSV